MKTELLNKVSRTLNKGLFQLKKHSPEILVVAGIAGAVTSTVMACKATTKLSEVLDSTKEQLDSVHEAVNNEELIKSGRYTEDDGKKDLVIIYAQTGIKLAKLYGPSIILGTLSLSSIVMSNRILNRRNVALAAAYATVDKGFKEYRGRVVDRFGKEIDHQLRHNIKAQEVEMVEVDEKGNEKKVTKVVDVAEPGTYSDFAKFFDECNTYWQKDPEYNLMFLKQTERAANDRLKSKGYLFLNDVYEMLGIDRTRAGQTVGWLYDEENPTGDNYVDFGMYDVYTRNPRNDEAKRMFINGYERSILLDFNVDGNILNKI